MVEACSCKELIRKSELVLRSTASLQLNATHTRAAQTLASDERLIDTVHRPKDVLKDLCSLRTFAGYIFKCLVCHERGNEHVQCGR